MLRTACLVSVLALSAACGGEPPPPASPPSSGPPAEAAVDAGPGEAPAAAAGPDAGATASTAAAAADAGPSGGPPGPGQWDSWSFDQKKEYMKSAVLPKMGALFHDYDAKRFAAAKCTLCHGASAKDGTFRMPNPALPKLPGTPEGFKKLHDQHPKAVDFMAKEVVPTMAGLVGEAPYDPKTQQGFGCFECHTKK
jgi:hypothetical protein